MKYTVSNKNFGSLPFELLDPHGNVIAVHKTEARARKAAEIMNLLDNL